MKSFWYQNLKKNEEECLFPLKNNMAAQLLFELHLNIQTLHTYCHTYCFPKSLGMYTYLCLKEVIKKNNRFLRREKPKIGDIGMFTSYI